MTFEEAYLQFWHEFGESRVMVLSTSFQDAVTSRTMSIVALEEKLYFQTDKTFRKYEQLKANPNVALCIDNIQMEGQCCEVGKPLEHPGFCYFKGNTPDMLIEYVHVQGIFCRMLKNG